MNKIIVVLLIAAHTLGTNESANAQTHEVGFKIIRHKSTKGNPWIIALWYPAKDSRDKSRMNMLEYIHADKRDSLVVDSTLLRNFKRVLKMWYGDASYGVALTRALSKPTLAFRDAKVEDGRFPLVVTFQEPSATPQSFEYLASRGIVVATVYSRYVRPTPYSDSLFYVPMTNELDELINYMSPQSFVDPENVTGIGHGGSIEAPFLLAMRNSKLNRLVNVDGGVFSPRSNTTRDPDYNPVKLKAPLLYFATQTQRDEDDPRQFDVLSNKKYRLVIKDKNIDHLYWPSYGEVMRDMDYYKNESDIEKILLKTNMLIVKFVKGGKVAKRDIGEGFEMD
jgi:hypothetical protein